MWRIKFVDESFDVYKNILYFNRVMCLKFLSINNLANLLHKECV